MDHLCYFCLVFGVCLVKPCGHLLGKGCSLGSRFLMSNCEVVTFPLASWVRNGACLYRFLILALFLTFLKFHAQLSWI